MLEKIRELRESITQEQREAFDLILNEEQMAAFGAVLSSAVDGTRAARSIGRLRDLLAADSATVALGLWSKLTSRQRDLIQEIMEDGA